MLELRTQNINVNGDCGFKKKTHRNLDEHWFSVLSLNKMGDSPAVVIVGVVDGFPSGRLTPAAKLF